MIYGSPAQPEYSDRNLQMKSVALLLVFFQEATDFLCVDLFFHYIITCNVCFMAEVAICSYTQYFTKPKF